MLKPLFGLLASLALFSIPVQAEEFHCPWNAHFPGYTLSTQPACRASLTLSLQKPAPGYNRIRVCLSEDLWNQWLARKPAPILCGELSGRWKLSASLTQDGISDPKTIFPTFRLSMLPSLSSDHGENVPGFWQSIERRREQLSQGLKSLDPWAVYRAMILGGHDPSAPHEFLRLIGFYHLLSASGLHLYALALAVNWITGSLLLSARMPAPLALILARGLKYLAWLWAWILCGSRPGMLRPGFVVGAKSCSEVLGFRWRFWTPFVLSMVLELGISAFNGHPWFSHSQLEIALSIGGFLLAFSDRKNPKQALHAFFGSWLLVSIAQALKTKIISLSAPFLSGLTLPLFCTLTYPFVLLESAIGMNTPLSAFLIAFSQKFLELLVKISLALPDLWVVSKGALLLSMALSLACIVLSFCLSRRTRFFLFIGLFLILFGARWLSQDFSPGKDHPILAQEVIQLDVGQGDSALVMGPSAGLIDAGSAHSLNDAQWIHALGAQGVTRLDWIALTHLDEDHRGGIDHLSRLIPIGCVLSSKQELESPRGLQLTKDLLSRGVRTESWESGSMPYPVFKPREMSQKHGRKHASGNSHMSAVLVPLASGDFYLSAGDAEGDDEITILQWANQNAKGPGHRIYKISHHGSKTSSDPKALRVFHPELALISVGLGNSYGHPSQEVLDRLSQMRIPVYRTDQMGAIRAEAFLRQPREHLP